MVHRGKEMMPKRWHDFTHSLLKIRGYKISDPTYGSQSRSPHTSRPEKEIQTSLPMKEDSKLMISRIPPAFYNPSLSIPESVIYLGLQPHILICDLNGDPNEATVCAQSHLSKLTSAGA